MIDPDDPRHGQAKGYVAGCRDKCCQTAIADWMRHYRTRQYLYGPLTVDSRGTRRRIRALMALGWSTTQLDEALGQKRTYTASVVASPNPIRRTTAQRYAALYAQFSMSLPPTETRYQKQRATRVRNLARRNGWSPPLAWNDIDTDEEPQGLRDHDADTGRSDPLNRRASLLEMVERGDGLSAVCRQLGVKPNTLYVWCLRHNMRDTWRTLTDREGDWNSPYRASREGAA